MNTRTTLTVLVCALLAAAAAIPATGRIQLPYTDTETIQADKATARYERIPSPATPPAPAPATTGSGDEPGPVTNINDPQPPPPPGADTDGETQLVWSHRTPTPPPPGKVDIEVSVDGTEWVADAFVHGYDRLTYKEKAAMKKAGFLTIRNYYSTTLFDGFTERGQVRVDCHLFHDQQIFGSFPQPSSTYLDYRKPPVPQTFNATINCDPPGGKFVPNQPVPARLGEGSKTLPPAGTIPIGLPEYDVRTEDGWITVKVGLNPSAAARWTTPGGAWLIDANIVPLPKVTSGRHQPVEHSWPNCGIPLCGIQLPDLRVPGGFEGRFQCGYGYEQVEVTLEQAREQTTGPGAGVYYYPVPGYSTVIDIPPCDTE